MEGSVFLNLPLPVTLAFFALLAGLILLACALHQLRRPAIVRPSVHRAAPHREAARSD